MQMPAADFPGERRLDLPGCPRSSATWVPPQAKPREAETLRCKEIRCPGRAHSRGYCTTHYRRWRSGQPMDAPIRRYRRKRKRPFAAEYALLAELGLRRN
jgi:hypothetical protein